ncbi:MAG: phosphoribosylanthranilate isomerase [Planctomycetaceae bacterium]|nr:phosphoribosylanthranilate isomerase [Planctomycetaceae bacterium]
MWLKICGVTRPELARQIAALGPDAIGLNFYSHSVRCVDRQSAEQIVRELPERVEPVGVFVNHSATEVIGIAASLGLRTVQLHGDEPVSVARTLTDAGLQIIRAFRVDESGLADVKQQLADYTTTGVPLRACLVDARVAGQYGGTGERAPWDLLRKEWPKDWPPLVLAGGLTAENVATAIEQVRPWGVDTASGVEASPGVQDLAVVASYITAARRAATRQSG